MGKRVHVDSYTRRDETHVKSYTRYDPRARHYKELGELPPEDAKPSFLSDGIEEESEDNESSEKETKTTTTKQTSRKKGEYNESD